MSAIRIFQIVAALATAATGLFAMFAPLKVIGFTGLQPIGGRGITELRAVLGGLFIALGVAPLFLGATAYRMLGIGYLAIFGVRAVSMFVDHSVVRSNVISLVTEIVLGVVLILQFVAEVSSTPASLGLLDGLAVIAWAVGFTFEAVGDGRLTRFKADPA